MDKKKCPQCKNLISVNSPTCLYCGRPNKFITKEYVNAKWKVRNNRKANHNILRVRFLISFLIIAIVFFIYSN